MQHTNTLKDLDLFNYGAIAILEHQGNRLPSQSEIDSIEEKLRHLCKPDELARETLSPGVIAELASKLVA